MITYQLSRFKEYQGGIKAQDLKFLKQINNFKQQTTNDHQYIKQFQSDSKKQNSNNASPKRLKDHILSPTSKLMKEWDNLGEEEKKITTDISIDKGGHKNLKPSLKNRPIIELQSLEKESNKEESNLKKLEYKSQFNQRNQIKRITNLLIQSRQERQDSREYSAMKLITQSAQRREKKSITIEKVMSPASVNLYQKPLISSSFKLNPNVVEGNINSSHNSNFSNFERMKVKVQKDTILIPKLQSKELIEKTAEKEKEKVPEKEKEKAPEKKNTISYEEFLGSSVDFDQLFFRKTVNLGNKKVDEFYEVMEENPTFKTNETTTTNTGITKSNFDNKKMSMLSISTKYRTLNNDFEDMAQTDFAIERILIKFSKIWLYFPSPRNRETVEEYKEDIFIDNILFSKGNLFLYSFFNLAVCLLWLLIHDDIDGFNGFFSTRIVVLSLALICAKYWTKDFSKKYHKGIILWYYGFTAIQILLFTIINPQIQIVMEIEFLVCYISLTRYAFITFIDSIIISVIFLVLHIIYLNIITVPAFLMLHSTFVMIFFNLVGVHIQTKTQIDNFNNSRINVIKKKQLNNLIVNLLPKHVFKAELKILI